MQYPLPVAIRLPLLLLFFLCFLLNGNALAQKQSGILAYTVSTPKPASHYFHVELQASGWNQDTIELKMPKWSPGYYQILDYANAVENFEIKDEHQRLVSKKVNDNTWQITGIRNKTFNLSYDVKADKQFVAQSYLDSARGYIIPASMFMYVDGHLNTPVRITLDVNKQWKIATGLTANTKKQNEFTAPDFDILYDCPILTGNLEELPSFKVKGVEHRFIGYNMGTFDRKQFMQNLEKVVASAITVIGDVPFNQYTFIGIGPGRGGIEHLNNTTVSFSGDELHSPEGMNRMMIFLAHEYFHHYNVKRIRPFELGPFDYDKGNKTNLLWVSEGLSVYYEYLIVKRAGLIDEKTLYADFEKNINKNENNPGRLYQSLTQASYKTWSDGPFGTQGEDANKSISYYDKGPVVGLLLDFAIRHATQNKKSLDDVMRHLYWQYYKKLGRGFTDAEFEQTCEIVAGVPLTSVFEYVYTTKELDYNTYLAYGGLTTDIQDTPKGKKYTLKRIEKMDALQSAIWKSWLEE